MDDELTMEEEQRMGELQQDRLEDYSAGEATPPVPKQISF